MHSLHPGKVQEGRTCLNAGGTLSPTESHILRPCVAKTQSASMWERRAPAIQQRSVTDIKQLHVKSRIREGQGSVHTRSLQNFENEGFPSVIGT